MVSELFDRAAQGYDRSRRQLLPCFDDLYGAALRRLPRGEPGRPLRVLDIGAGTGLLTALVAERLPEAELTLVDLAGDMLARAAERMARYGGRVRIRQLDMTRAAELGSFDVVVSALAIHHLDDAQKRQLFHDIRAMLPPGGRFVHIEQVLGPTPAAEREYEAVWREEARARGASDADMAAAAERMAHDRCATLVAQLGWLEEADFVEVACWYQWYRFAVYSGDAPGRAG